LALASEVTITLSPEGTPVNARFWCNAADVSELYLGRHGSVVAGVESNFRKYLPEEVALMQTIKEPDSARREMTLIGKSVVIKGELSCGEDLYIDGQVEGAIDPKGNRLTIGPNARVKANINACAVVVQGKLEGNIQATDRVDLKQSAVVMGDIATQRISIDEGAYFKGSVNIQKEALKKELPGVTSLSPN
jgi:cytoskeletal protein CcmA (bactofilin family)